MTTVIVLGAKLAVTVQFAVIGPVVNVEPASEPPQPLAPVVWEPAGAVTVKVAVSLYDVVCGVGVTFAAGEPVTVNEHARSVVDGDDVPFFNWNVWPLPTLDPVHGCADQVPLCCAQVAVPVTAETVTNMD